MPFSNLYLSPAAASTCQAATARVRARMASLINKGTSWCAHGHQSQCRVSRSTRAAPSCLRCAPFAFCACAHCNCRMPSPVQVCPSRNAPHPTVPPAESAPRASRLLPLRPRAATLQRACTSHGTAAQAPAVNTPPAVPHSAAQPPGGNGAGATDAGGQGGSLAPLALAVSVSLLCRVPQVCIAHRTGTGGG